MPLPNLMKTWVMSVNNVVTSSGEASPYSVNFKNLIFEIKNTMKTLLTGSGNEWTVVGSSNSVTSSMDGVDRWLTVSNIVNSAGAHSWLVLKQDAIAANYQLLFDFNDSTVYYMSIKVSPTVGFSGGSASVAPTASDSIAVNNISTPVMFNWANASWNDGINPMMFNVWASDDGQVTRIGVVHKGQITGLWFFEKPYNPISQWSSSSISATITPDPTPDNWFTYTSNASRFVSRINNGSVAHRIMAVLTRLGAYFSYPGSPLNSAAIPFYLFGYNTFTLEYEFVPLGLYCTTVGARGRQGNLVDVWLSHWTIPDGATFPGDDTRQFVKWGAFVLPWNGIDKVKMF